ncbi:MAG: hypothetical protein H7Z38_11150 [Rubrivivax sp.]|nr:hypothetical protein [Pyrinomonadaceae bacterium]
MKKLTTVLFVIMLSNCLAAAQTKSRREQKVRQKTAVAAVDPEVDRIFQRFAEAQGDPRAIRSVHSTVMRGVIEIPQYALNGSVEVYAKDPNKKLTVLNMPGPFGQRLEARNGKGGWGQKPSAAAYDVTRNTEQDIEGVNGLIAKTHYSKLSLKGKAIVGVREAYVIEGTQPGAPPELLYFDTQNGLMVRHDVVKKGKDDDGAGSTFFEGFAKVNGIVMPTVIREVYKEFTVITRFYEVKFNVHIEDSLFERPKGPNPDGKEEKVEKVEKIGSEP